MAKSLYDKSVRELMRDMIPIFGIEQGKIFTRSQVRSWFKENYPKIKDGTISAHLLRMSVNAPSRIHYSAKPGEDDLFYQVDSTHFRLYSPENDPSPIYAKDHVETQEIEAEDTEQVAQNEFAYEKDLQNFLAKNLDTIEPQLSLFEDEGIKGIEFPVGGRFIDILAIDKNNDWVVIELKVSKGYDRVVGQLLRYMAWIRKNYAEPSQQVRGIIVARDISEDLTLACSELPNIQLFEYQLSVKLNKVAG
jgi:hypothetical protein